MKWMIVAKYIGFQNAANIKFSVCHDHHLKSFYTISFKFQYSILTILCFKITKVDQKKNTLQNKIHYFNNFKIN